MLRARFELSCPTVMIGVVAVTLGKVSSHLPLGFHTPLILVVENTEGGKKK